MNNILSTYLIIFSDLESTEMLPEVMQAPPPLEAISETACTIHDKTMNCPEIRERAHKTSEAAKKITTVTVTLILPL